ncbi:hypothetical protein Fcan01_16185 [Folsomia candida]|uniref:Uncharacterized protein n=1 Tax=Folsomia candida TaxID=158441 RepID=A0A226DTE3_FOLCA|nr:hypothetical protein Fcan01_16185 [Folsomia candida]
MIIPTKYRSPWETLLDVEGIQVLIPIFLLSDDDKDMIPRIGDIPYRFFYMELLTRLRDIAEQGVEYQRHVKYRRTANRLLEKLLDHMGVDADLNPIKDQPFFDKSSLHNFPIQPVEYDDGDTYGVVGRLSRCGKIALMVQWRILRE